MREIGEYLAMDDVPFKPRAYEKVAQVVEGMQQELSELYQKGGTRALMEIEGIGKEIAAKIEELIKTGKLQYYEQLKKATPVDLSTLTHIEGLGPKKIIRLYRALNIKTLVDLEKAVARGKMY